MNYKVLGKFGPYAPDGGATSGYLIEEDDFKFLLDMGSGVLSKLSLSDVKSLDGIFISHLHYDHTSDLLPFRYLLEQKNIKVKIYTEKQDGVYYDLLFRHPNLEVINVDERSVITVKGKELTFYRMVHPSPDLGIKIKGRETLAYTGDTVFNDNLFALAEGADVLIADCAKPDTFKGGHMTVSDAKIVLEKTGLKRLVVTHFDPGTDLSTLPITAGMVFA